MTFRQLLTEGTRRLHDAGIEDAAADAWFLLERAAGMSRASYLMHSGEPVPEETTDEYMRLICRREQRIPLQHILGEQEFMGFPFRVTGDVLIPRQETELLVEEALRRIRRAVKKRENDGEDGEAAEVYRVLDLCTGSGCIAISLALLAGEERGTGQERLSRDAGRETEGGENGDGETVGRETDDGENGGHETDDHENGDGEIAGHKTAGRISVCAGDLSPGALEVARENAELLGARVDFYESDLFERIPGNFDLIVSNPPYIAHDVIASLEPEVRDHDPVMALDGGGDGLDFYRRICAEAPARLRSGGQLLMEIGWDQAQAVSRLLEKEGFQNIAVLQDLAGRYRIAAGVLQDIAGRDRIAGGVLQEEETVHL